MFRAEEFEDDKTVTVDQNGPFVFVRVCSKFVIGGRRDRPIIVNVSAEAKVSQSHRRSLEITRG